MLLPFVGGVHAHTDPALQQQPAEGIVSLGRLELKAAAQASTGVERLGVQVLARQGRGCPHPWCRQLRETAGSTQGRTGLDLAG